ncbi:MAG: XamI family restriction endonuclease, partial [Actinomycetota bacterium]|nr:XamI family restriction endonuclease [Actinomycetota bacterium]
MTQSPPRWTSDQFERGVAKAIEVFRDERLNEAREDYTSHFDDAQSAVEDLLELTVDLTELRANGHAALTRYYEATRYLTAPPISHDDLQTLSGVAARFQRTADGWPPTIDTVIELIDRQRFPWLIQNRQPTEAEKRAAVLATAAQVAARRVLTARANEAKSAQEQVVKDSLLGAGFAEVEPRTINTMRSAPGPGEFCGECMLG